MRYYIAIKNVILLEIIRIEIIDKISRAVPDTHSVLTLLLLLTYLKKWRDVPTCKMKKVTKEFVNYETH